MTRSSGLTPTKLGKRYERNPGEKTASIEYARALRALTRYNEAVAVIQTAAIKAPKDFDVLGEYGKALADAGQLPQAKDVLAPCLYARRCRAGTSCRCRGRSPTGSAIMRRAMQFYHEALKIAPGEPSVLTNMGLSLALAKQLPEAEEALRQAVASPKADARMRGDLALVLALEGKFGDAETVGQTDLSPDAARANVEAIRQMIAQNGSLRDLGKPAKGAKPKARQRPKTPADAVRNLVSFPRKRESEYCSQRSAGCPSSAGMTRDSGANANIAIELAGLVRRFPLLSIARPNAHREGQEPMSDMTLWGFDGSTYVRTVKMVLAEKGVTDFKQVPLNVLAGDPKTPEHRERHPFGKVPVLDHDGMRLLETTAIARYLNDVLPGKSLIPSSAQGSRADGHDHRPHRLLRLRRA